MIAEPDFGVLKRMRLFDRLSDLEMAQLSRGATVRSIPKGTILFEEGDPADRFYGVLDGWIKIYKVTRDGEQAVLGIFGRGETFAEAAMFVGRAYPASAEAVDNCRIVAYGRDAFEAGIAANPRLCLGMLGSISAHLHHMVLQVEQLKTRNARQRLAHFLLGLCDGTAGPATVTLPYDKGLVAARLGMTPESFSRNLAKLSTLGVRTKGNIVTIDDIQVLADRGVEAERRKTA